MSAESGDKTASKRTTTRTSVVVLSVTDRFGTDVFGQAGVLLFVHLLRGVLRGEVARCFERRHTPSLALAGRAPVPKYIEPTEATPPGESAPLKLGKWETKIEKWVAESVPSGSREEPEVGGREGEEEGREFSVVVCEMRQRDLL